ncbi:Nephrocystin-3 [Madurella mycetomatis]|uniref:Nephrocystin-3 n=1 Tax=Madurella mycetomatis TaxID=100816 RepID=A0A175VRR7_9PEZI|nr:Nephrocystin-3 [Madurella mycetomatis]
MRKFLRRAIRQAPGPEHNGSTGAGSTAERFPTGIRLLHEPENSIVDIVFVHGLAGHREKTWTAEHALSPWPQALLPSKIPSARILTFGYDAHVAGWRRVVSESRIKDHAWNLLTALSTYRDEDDTNERPIFFVCHSLGGLVCEDALVISQQRTEQHLRNIFLSTRGIVFLGTPHHGAGLARWAEMFASFLGHIKQTNTRIVEVFKRDSEVLARIQDSFQTMIMARTKDGQPIQITCFYEQLPLEGLGLVVPQDSAILPGYIPIGIHSNHMDMARFDKADNSGFIAVCGELRRWSRELRLVSTEAPLANKSLGLQSLGGAECAHWMVPFGRNRDFVGRKQILAQLLEKIRPGSDKDGCQRTAINGLGGVGKTQLALEAAFRVRGDCSVFWVPAIDASSFENAYREIGRRLNVKGIEEDKGDVKALVKAALSHENVGSWLLVIDNADDAELLFGAGGLRLSDCVPFSLNGSVLITTRNHDVAMKLDISNRNTLVLREMTKSEATKLLERNLPESQRDAQSMASLLDFLAGLPLAIKQASAFMSKTGMPASKYLGHCQSSDKDLIRLLSKDFEDRGRYNAIQNPIATTWLISFDQISQDNWLAAVYLRFACFLAEKNVPVSLLQETDDELGMIEALGTLKAYAFITLQDGGDSFDMHRLVRLAMRNWLANQKQGCIAGVIQRLSDVFPFPEHENRDVWMSYLPHAQAALAFKDADDDEAKGRLLETTAIAVARLGKYGEAEQMQRQALELRKKVLGEEHPDTLGSINNLATILGNLKRYEEAEQIHRQALELRKKVLGEEHPDTLGSINNLAITLGNLRRYKEAEQMHRQVFELRKKVLGEEHPDTLGSINNLAITLGNLRRYKEAEQMHRQVFELRKKVLGEEHPDTLGSINNLAITLGNLRRYKEAEQMHRQVFELRKKVLGEEHPDTLGSINNLAITLGNLRRYKEAEQMHRQVFELRKKVLGEEHPDTLRSIYNLAIILWDIGRYEEAEQMHRQVLGLFEKVLGKTHPDTEKGRGNLATYLEAKSTVGTLALRMWSVLCYGASHVGTVALGSIARITLSDTLFGTIDEEGTNYTVEGGRIGYYHFALG